jgi:hypothetical protein
MSATYRPLTFSKHSACDREIMAGGQIVEIKWWDRLNVAALAGYHP